MPKWMRVMMFLGAGGLLASIIAFIVLASVARPGGTKPAGGMTRIDSKQMSEALKDLNIREFSLVDQRGQKVDRSVFLGKVTIVDFIFTHCPLACPRMTGEMGRLQTRLSDTSVKLLSFSLDPDNDTPAKLTEWGESFKADFSRWTFVTEPAGSSAKTGREIFAHDLKQHVDDDPKMMLDVGNGKQMANIQHSVNFFLIGPDGKVAGVYNSFDAGAMDQLAFDARKLAKKLGK
jgi:cytochrome oxidase Cu insertion factor (SCO1/SenC/PrrC family)